MTRTLLASVVICSFVSWCSGYAMRASALGLEGESPSLSSPGFSARLVQSDAREQVVESTDGQEDTQSPFVVTATVKGAIKVCERRNAAGACIEKWQAWSEAGKPDVNHGRYEMFWPDGTRKRSGSFDMGALSGMWRNWDEHGKLKSLTTCDPGGLTGPHLTVFPDGLSMLHYYQSGERSGLSVTWEAATRTATHIDFFEGGVQVGRSTSFLRGTGLPISSGEYKDGKETGEWLLWGSTGHLTRKMHLQEGKLDGVVQDWYESGRPDALTTFQNGVRNGPICEWHENGQVKQVGQYKAGKKVARWQTWNAQGELLEDKDFGE